MRPASCRRGTGSSTVKPSAALCGFPDPEGQDVSPDIRSGVSKRGGGPLSKRRAASQTWTRAQSFVATMVRTIFAQPVVDVERGILLRAAVIVEGEELSVREVVEVVFDEPIRPELFRPLH
jgi:hypothetical protein